MPLGTKWRRHMRGEKELRKPRKGRKVQPPTYVQEQDQRQLAYIK